nr:unnamed protein product [Spirometra erinaceieuropaei]
MHSEESRRENDQAVLKEVFPPLTAPPKPSPSAPSSIDPTSPRKQLATTTTRRPYSELELSSAVQAICSGQLGTRRAASVYGIPRSTLRNKICKLNELRRREEELLGGGRQLSLIEFVRLCAMGRPSTTVRQTSLGMMTAGLMSGRRHASVASRVSSVFRVNCRRSIGKVMPTAEIRARGTSQGSTERLAQAAKQDNQRLV